MFEIGKYKGRWAIFDTISLVWYFCKGGRRGCEKLCKDLNERG